MQSLLWVWYDTVSWATGKAFSLQNVLQLSQCLDWGPSSNSGNVCRLNENADELCVCVYDCNEVTKYSAQMLPVFPLNAATSRKVGKLSTMSCSSFTALPLHSAMTLTKLPPNLCAQSDTTHTNCNEIWLPSYCRQLDNGVTKPHTHTTISQPLYKSTCVSWHRSFLEQNFTAHMPCWWQLVHSD